MIQHTQERTKQRSTRPKLRGESEAVLVGRLPLGGVVAVRIPRLLESGSVEPTKTAPASVLYYRQDPAPKTTPLAPTHSLRSIYAASRLRAWQTSAQLR